MDAMAREASQGQGQGTVGTLHASRTAFHAMNQSLSRRGLTTCEWRLTICESLAGGRRSQAVNHEWETADPKGVR